MKTTDPTWRVPYTAPGVIRGHLIVRATSREDAINAAVQLHGKRATNHLTGNPSWRLSTKSRAQIDYGEPEPANDAARAIAERGAA